MNNHLSYEDRKPDYQKLNYLLEENSNFFKTTQNDLQDKLMKQLNLNKHYNTSKY